MSIHEDRMNAITTGLHVIHELIETARCCMDDNSALNAYHVASIALERMEELADEEYNALWKEGTA